MIKNYIITLIVIVLSTIVNLQAQSPYLVKDLNDNSEINGGRSISVSLSTNGRQMKMLNDVLIYGSRDAIRGLELWRTDGTVQGTYIVKDINENGSSYPSQFIKFGNILVFATRDGELWKTDGTTEGTVLLKAGFGDNFKLDSFDQEVFFNNTLYFTITEGEMGENGLWKTDGTPEGTVLIKSLEIRTSNRNRTLNVQGSNILFFVAVDEVHGAELWKSDGTAEGTVLLKDIREGIIGSSVSWMTKVDNTLFFTANDRIHGVELWKSDGTTTGTVLVKDIREGFNSSNPKNLINFNNKLYFSYQGDLWQSDGTESGTFNFADAGILTVSVGGRERLLFKVHENILYFTSDLGFSLWKTDGTPQGTEFVSRFGAYKTITALMPFQNELCLRIRSTERSNYVTELWKTNGTTAGTVQLKDINPRLYGSISLLDYSRGEEANGKLYFIAYDIDVRSARVWKTDGTPDGTTILAPGIGTYENATRPSRPSSFIDVNGITLFLSNDKLWRTDGKNENTVELRAFSHIYDPVSYNNVIYFKAKDPILGLGLWKSDGTSSGTVLVKTINPQINVEDRTLAGLVVNGLLYFTANDGVHGAELWKSDGTEAGTVMVKDINQEMGASSEIFTFRNLNNTLYFSANDGVHGAELWKSDGTAAGTVLVKDILPEAGSSRISYLSVAVNNLLYFAANDGVHGAELWKSDGTEAGTVMVKDISDNLSSSVSEITTVSDGVIFIVDRDELWKSDGTEAGTLLLKKLDDPNQTIQRFTPNGIVSSGSYLYASSFETAGGNTNIKLWRSDGTPEGTVLVKAFEGNSFITLYEIIENILYFRASDAAYGFELWKSDGTEAGTVIVKDINPGKGDSSPSSFKQIDDMLYFSADDGVHGEELWKTDGTTEGTVLVADMAEGALSSFPYIISKVNGITYLSAQPRSKSNFNYGRELMALGNCTAENTKFSNLYPLENVIFTSEAKAGSTTETCYCNIFNELLNSTDATGVNPILDVFTNTVYMDEFTSPDFVSRHYEVAPETNIASTTGGVTLYFTQEEFDAFNALQNDTSPSGKGNTSNTQLQLLPTTSSDIANISNIRILNRAGNSNDGSGIVDSYPEDVTVIDPEDTDIVWNGNDGFWEVRFNTDAFGGFWLTSALRAETLDLDAFVKEDIVTLSPNPAQTHITFKGLKTPKSYTIYNVHGAVVQKGMATNVLKADVTALSSGMYIVKFDDESLSIKVLKN